MDRTPDIMTIDVEEWFHGHNYLQSVPPAEWEGRESRVESNVEFCLELLDRHRTTATFFVLGWVAARHPGMVARIAAAGHEIACHGHDHPVVNKIDAGAFCDDLDRALEALVAAGATEVRGYRAPSFTITPSVHHYWHILRERGFTYDCSLFPVHHSRYGQPGGPRRPFLLAPEPGDVDDGRLPLLVMPMTTARILGVNLPFAGGSYLRLLPRWAYRMLRRVARRQGQPVVTYMHPWEIDDYVPDVRLSAATRLRSQGQQQSTPAKIESILAAGSFKTMGEHAAALRGAGDLETRQLPLF